MATTEAVPDDDGAAVEGTMLVIEHPDDQRGLR
jgi:hypothetical protein